MAVTVAGEDDHRRSKEDATFSNRRRRCMAAAVFKNQRSTNDHIAALCKQKLYSQALQGLNLVRFHALLPILPSTYAHLAASCSALRSPDHAITVHQHIMGSGSDAGVVLNNYIVTMYGKCGLVVDALKVFDEMPWRNLVSWGSMMAGYSKNRCDWAIC